MVFHIRAYTLRGLGTPTESQHNLFDSEKLKVVLVLLTGFKPLTFGSPVQCSPTSSQHNLIDSEKLKVVLVLLTGFEPLTFGSLVQHSNH